MTDPRIWAESGDAVDVSTSTEPSETSPVFLTVLDVDHATTATAALTEDEAEQVAANLGAAVADSRRRRGDE